MSGRKATEAGDPALVALLDRVIPAEDGPGAVECGLAAAVRSRDPDLDDLLSELSGFENLTVGEQDAVLARLDAPGAAFRRFVELAQEVYYADPRSWPSIGYTSNVPGRP